ncbi:MAG: carbon-nitrogen hydrolase [Gammaproteobacteria bacterium]|nr:carbon-nitrogen hydrolase [Gammaproteobacteria bacterium]
MTEKKIKTGFIQHAHQGSTAGNLNYIRQEITSLAKDGTQLVVLQELHNSAYFCQQENTDNFDLAEKIKGSTFQHFSKLAEEFKLVIVSSIFEKRAEGIYHNTAIVIDNDGSLAGFYRKMHIPDDPGFHEKFYFTPGDHLSPAFQPVQTSVGKLGVLICWDQWYPEAARLMALAGADILIYPTAIGWDPDDTPQEQQRQLQAWQTIQRGHAIANHLPIITCNRTGFEAAPGTEKSPQQKGIQFWGNSFIAGPQGEILLQANEDIPASLYCEINLMRSAELRKIWPFFRDRRIEAYNDLTRRYIDQ